MHLHIILHDTLLICRREDPLPPADPSHSWSKLTWKLASDFSLRMIPLLVATSSQSLAGRISTADRSDKLWWILLKMEVRSFLASSTVPSSSPTWRTMSRVTALSPLSSSELAMSLRLCSQFPVRTITLIRAICRSGVLCKHYCAQHRARPRATPTMAPCVIYIGFVEH